MKIDKGPQKLSELFGSNAKKTIKPPAYEWQDLALRIIAELDVPGFKRASVFKACKDNSKEYIEKCFNETKELCHSGAKWKYFFKVIDTLNKKPE